ncbi:hypothetical protein CXG81DRAFT_17185 [Caulochytrium protostelioides]|uniref:Uncharacterized protein n=1 Tax=Caulochytrium protostelioides TaxID=1555241 RepID=A0A4P9XCQ3_9FUNG|nr:hypothetical protein CXG81DRAFT_17185 [Caulochytrium protostelioides]|eukprot:RKP03228.1 hypothetical protein CXG81DRAFT_17185 [Caulochytrium protostelioides]
MATPPADLRPQEAAQRAAASAPSLDGRDAPPQPRPRKSSLAPTLADDVALLRDENQRLRATLQTFQSRALWALAEVAVLREKHERRRRRRHAQRSHDRRPPSPRARGSRHRAASSAAASPASATSAAARLARRQTTANHAPPPAPASEGAAGAREPPTDGSDAESLVPPATRDGDRGGGGGSGGGDALAALLSLPGVPTGPTDAAVPAPPTLPSLPELLEAMLAFRRTLASLRAAALDPAAGPPAGVAEHVPTSASTIVPPAGPADPPSAAAAAAVVVVAPPAGCVNCAGYRGACRDHLLALHAAFQGAVFEKNDVALMEQMAVADTAALSTDREAAIQALLASFLDVALTASKRVAAAGVAAHRRAEHGEREREASLARLAEQLQREAGRGDDRADDFPPPPTHPARGAACYAHGAEAVAALTAAVARLVRLRHLADVLLRRIDATLATSPAAEALTAEAPTADPTAGDAAAGDPAAKRRTAGWSRLRSRIAAEHSFLAQLLSPVEAPALLLRHDGESDAAAAAAVAATVSATQIEALRVAAASTNLVYHAALVRLAGCTPGLVDCLMPVARPPPGDDNSPARASVAAAPPTPPRKLPALVVDLVGHGGHTWYKLQLVPWKPAPLAATSSRLRPPPAWSLLQQAAQHPQHRLQGRAPWLVLCRVSLDLDRLLLDDTVTGLLDLPRRLREAEAHGDGMAAQLDAMDGVSPTIPDGRDDDDAPHERDGSQYGSIQYGVVGPILPQYQQRCPPVATPWTYLLDVTALLMLVAETCHRPLHTVPGLAAIPLPGALIAQIADEAGPAAAAVPRGGSGGPGGGPALARLTAQLLEHERWATPARRPCAACAGPPSCCRCPRRGRQFLTTASAVRSFVTILQTVGGPAEVQRAEALFGPGLLLPVGTLASSSSSSSSSTATDGWIAHVVVVPDAPSARFQALIARQQDRLSTAAAGASDPLARPSKRPKRCADPARPMPPPKMSLATLTIWGTADRHGVPVVSSNGALARAFGDPRDGLLSVTPPADDGAHAPLGPAATLLHPPRSLTETRFWVCPKPTGPHGMAGSSGSSAAAWATGPAAWVAPASAIPDRTDARRPGEDAGVFGES